MNNSAPSGQATAHVESYYAASANPSPMRDRIEANVEADVCVIGAGFSGLSSALHLAEKGYRVVVLQSDRA